MGARAAQLAGKFDESCTEFNKVVEGLSDADWRNVTSAEKWPVGVVAHHLAEGHANNAKHAKEYANVTKAETFALLKANGEKTSALVRPLSDEDLDRSASLLGGMATMTAAQAIEGF